MQMICDSAISQPRNLATRTMRILGILNHKGGTGKTTTAVNLAAGLALRGSRVLLVDLDAQGSVAATLGVKYERTMTDLLLGNADLDACISPARENLDIIASDRSLIEAEGALWRMNNHDASRLQLRKKLGGVKSRGYEFVVLDYSPSISLMGQNGLLYSRELIVPVSMDYLALMGTRQVINTLKEIGRIQNHQLKLTAVVPTFYYGRLRKDREVLDTLKRYFDKQVTNPIRANVKMAEAPGHRMTIYEYAPESNGAKDYEQLVERIGNRSPPCHSRRL